MLIAQITDLHITLPGAGIMRGVDPTARLEASVAHLNALSPAPDVVLVTGDLVHSGSDEEYAILLPMLERIEAPYYVIPGNHDERGAFRRAFAGHDCLPADGEFLHYVLDQYALRLIGLDTTLPGELGGEMDAPRLAWLEARLSEAPERPTVIFMHHPPFATGLAALDTMCCAGGDEMGAIVARHGEVERIVCGHVHRPVQLRWHGTVALTAPSTAAQFRLELAPDKKLQWTGEPPACLLHLWQPGTGLLTHTSLIGDFPTPEG
jgi:3',5'-cyclic AMP phosphodiesterase CpdA